jgi:hypothetical protein
LPLPVFVFPGSNLNSLMHNPPEANSRNAAAGVTLGLGSPAPENTVLIRTCGNSSAALRSMREHSRSRTAASRHHETQEDCGG